MTADPFIEAAREEATRMFLDGVNRSYNIAMKEARGGFVAGAEWARTHLAAQEPSDATALQERVARALYENAEYYGPEPTQPSWDTRDGEERGEWMEIAATVLPIVRAEVRARQAEAQSDARGRAAAVYQQRAREAEARIKAAEALHQREWHGDLAYCRRCLEAEGAIWPCPTIRALRGEE